MLYEYRKSFSIKVFSQLNLEVLSIFQNLLRFLLVVSVKPNSRSFNQLRMSCLIFFVLYRRWGFLDNNIDPCVRFIVVFVGHLVMLSKVLRVLGRRAVIICCGETTERIQFLRNPHCFFQSVYTLH